MAVLRIARLIPARMDPVVLGLCATLAAAVVGLVGGVRVPYVHDEFAYLLIGETLAEGRLTNPTPPAWASLETFHVLMVPTYTGKYPPGQGLVLALGLLMGSAIVGVWLSAGLMVGATTWMLRAFVPRPWALAGGACVLFQLGIASYFAQSYWGGALAATGGALLYGAARRLWEAPSAGLWFLVGTALLVLANSRPLEGLVVSLPALALLIKPARRSLILAAGVLVPLGAGAGAMAAYNAAVVGSPATMPYQVYQERYAVSPNLLFSSVDDADREYRHPRFEDFWVGWDLGQYHQFRTLDGFLKSRLGAALRLWLQSIGLFGLGIGYLRWGQMSVWMKGAAYAALSATGLVLFTKAALAHYLAPAIPIWIMLATVGWSVAFSRDQGPRRLAFAAAAMMLWVPAFQVLYQAGSDHDRAQDWRAEVEACLANLPLRSLVIVDYIGPLDHYAELVHNAPIPTYAEVVWASPASASERRILEASYPDRFLWRVSVEAELGAPGNPILRIENESPSEGVFNSPDCLPTS